MRRDRFIAGLCCAGTLLLAAPAARAVVISPYYEVPNLKAPANDPGWTHVGRIDGGSAVYLGNRWVITANHVDTGNLRLADGRVLAESVGSSVRLKNTGTTIAPDLRMFRLAADPGLSAMSLATVAPGAGSLVTMIGAGVGREPELRGWQFNGSQWTEAPVPDANVFGYELGSDNKMRWGLNIISSASAFISQTGTRVFQTTFDKEGTTFEAQATTGDSGGGVFYQSNGSWQLAGLMIATQPLSNQPSDTVMYGQRTYIADLASYRQQIVDMMNRAEPLWQNQANNYDVNGSGGVNARDLIVLINEILGDGARNLTGSPTVSNEWLDVNGDYKLGTVDVQRVVNEILRERAAARAASPLSALTEGDIRIVPEPASGLLALAAGLLGLAAHRWLRRR